MIYIYLAGPDDQLVYQTHEAVEALSADAVFTEKEVGGRMVLSRLQQMLLPGDTLVSVSFSSVAASSFEFLHFLGQLRARGVGYRCLESGFDSQSPEGEAIAAFMEQLSALDAEPAREEPEETQEESQEEAASFKGRRPIAVDEDLFAKIVEKWEQGEITARKAMADLGLKPNTFYRRVKEKAMQIPGSESFVTAAKKFGKDLETGLRGEVQTILDTAAKAASNFAQSAGEPKNAEEAPAEAPVEEHMAEEAPVSEIPAAEAPDVILCPPPAEAEEPAQSAETEEPQPTEYL